MRKFIRRLLRPIILVRALKQMSRRLAWTEACLNSALETQRDYQTRLIKAMEEIDELHGVHGLDQQQESEHLMSTVENWQKQFEK